MEKNTKIICEKMKPFCEIMVQILPCVKALIAKKLTHEYKMTQKQAAEKMNTSQPAISQYKRELRGYKTEVFRNNSEFLERIDSLAKKIANDLSPEEQIREFCEICKFLKQSGLACELHKENEPSLQTCRICLQ